MEMMRLPNEILEKIARYLDVEDLVSFGLSHWRLLGIASSLAYHPKFTVISRDVQEFLSYNPLNVRTLDLSNCTSSSTSIQALIYKCRFVTELNVVNSSISWRHLHNIIKSLKELRHLSISLLDYSKSQFEHCLISQNYSIQHVYIEVNPVPTIFVNVLKFLNCCMSLEIFHINVFGQPTLNRGPPVRESCLLDQDRWETLHTVLVSCQFTNTLAHHTLIRRLFAFHGATEATNRWMLFNQEFCVYERGCFSNVLPPDDLPGTNSLVYLNRIYNIYIECRDFQNNAVAIPAPWGPPIDLKLRLPFRPFQFPFDKLTQLFTASLTRLDLTACHWRFSIEAWNSLVVQAPALEELAVALCFLRESAERHPTCPSCHEKANRQNKRPRLAPRSDDCPVVEALSKLKLRALHLVGPPGSDSQACMRCRLPVSSVNIGNLDMLPLLETLTIAHAVIMPSFYDRIWHPNVKTIKLIFLSSEHSAGLKKFLERCPSVENLKLEETNLPLHSNLIWEALIQTKRLRRLCISSESKELIDTKFVSDKFSKMKSTIKLLHIHAPKIANPVRLERSLRQFFSKQERYRHLVFPKMANPSLSNIKQVNMPQAFPGRDLCCPETFIGNIKPPGWF